MVAFFQYLGRVISADDDNWLALVRNLSRARAVWKRMTGILSREGAEPRMPGFFNKSMVQAVMFFGLETWVFNLCMGRALGGFQDQVVQRLTGRLPRNKNYRNLEYTSADMARGELGFQTMEEYIQGQQNKVTQYISMQSLLDLCEGSKREMGARIGIRS